MKYFIMAIAAAALTGCVTYPYPYTYGTGVYIYPNAVSQDPRPTVYICNQFGCYPQYR